ncbi:MAG: hypothetical protein ACREYA_20840, partial [Cupriavidus necator]
MRVTPHPAQAILQHHGVAPDIAAVIRVGGGRRRALLVVLRFVLFFAWRCLLGRRRAAGLAPPPTTTLPPPGWRHPQFCQQLARQRRFGFGALGPALRRGQLRLRRVQ